MRTSKVSSLSRKLVVLVCLGLIAPVANADGKGRNGHDHGDDHRLRASAVFGRGLNTAAPGNAINHAILPNRIELKAGGVVDFSVAGFHDIIVFEPGFELSDLIEAGGGGELPGFGGIFVVSPDPLDEAAAATDPLESKIYYRGIRPAGGPPPGHPAQDNPDNGSNRGEPVAFLEKGTYLVICNIRPHLIDGMYAYVRVR